MTLLQVKNLKKSYGEIKAVKGIDFVVEKGDIFGLLGPNGAGKSTTISMISTLFKPDSGEIIYDGNDIIKKPRSIQAKLGIVPQDIALYPTLSGYDNLKFWGNAYGIRGKELKKRIEVVSEIIGISDRLKDKVEKYSGGMKRRINIGAALLHNPEILIMDEPTVGIDPQSRNHILETVKKLNEKGMTIIYTSHYMEEVEYLCKNISIMDKGQIIASGTKENLINLINNETAMSVTFNKVDDELYDRISKIKEIKDIRKNDDSLEFLVVENNILGTLIKELKDTDYHILSMETKKPNLESVFLHLTGKALRD